MRDDFEYLENKAPKKWLATIANRPLYRLRRLEMICYLSLLLNMILAVCFLVTLVFGW